MPDKAPTAAQAQQWLVAQLAAELRISPDGIRVDRPILSYGIDSMRLVTILSRMEDWLGVRFSGNPLDEHPTIEALSLFVAGPGGRPGRAEPDRPGPDGR